MHHLETRYDETLVGASDGDSEGTSVGSNVCAKVGIILCELDGK